VNPTILAKNRFFAKAFGKFLANFDKSLASFCYLSNRKLLISLVIFLDPHHVKVVL